MSDLLEPAKTVQATRQKVPFRGGGFKPRPIRFVAPLVFLALVLFWEFGSRTGFISNLVLPAPSEAYQAFTDLYQSGLLWKHVSTSLYRLVFGWSIGTVLGILVGLLIGLFSLARASLLPLTSAFFSNSEDCAAAALHYLVWHRGRLKSRDNPVWHLLSNRHRHLWGR